jgi:hypothetical protein
MPENVRVRARKSVRSIARDVTLDRLRSSPAFSIHTTRSGSCSGSGDSIKGRSTLNTAVVAPTPSPITSASITDNPGARRIDRSAIRASSRRPFMRITLRIPDLLPKMDETAWGMREVSSSTASRWYQRPADRGPRMRARRT